MSKLSENKFLMDEWDYEKNNAIDLHPEKLLYKSNKNAWWKCVRGHSWQMEIYRRTEGRNCPYCANKRVLIGYNDLRTLLPKIAKEWHFEKNEGIDLFDCVVGSAKKVWWRCSDCGYEWIASIRSRTQRHSGCPECAKVERGKTRCKTNLRNGVSLNDPKLLEEWDYERNANEPSDYLPGSNEKVWWKCKKCGYRWASRVANRAILSRGCPCCANKVVVPGRNDLATTHPELAKEWHPSKNGRLSPSQVLAGSARKVWWLCPKGHEYKASLLHRGHGTNCPICNSGRQTSFAEQAIFYYVKQVFPDAENRVVGIIGRRMELDIYIPSQKIAIEYDGVFWHNASTFQRELSKYNECRRRGIKLHRIKEGKLSDSREAADYAWHMDNLEDKNQLSMMIRHILDKLDPRSNFGTRKRITDIHSPVNVDVKRDEFKIRRYMQDLKSESLVEHCPGLVKEWNYEKNEGLTPQMFKPASTQKVWWLCKVCKNEWEAEIYHRAKEGTGCPVCYRKRNRSGNHPEAKKIFQYSKDWELIRGWSSIAEASRTLQINGSNISMCAKHMRSLAGGFHWEYHELKNVIRQPDLFDSP